MLLISIERGEIDQYVNNLEDKINQGNEDKFVGGNTREKEQMCRQSVNNKVNYFYVPNIYY